MLPKEIIAYHMIRFPAPAKVDDLIATVEDCDGRTSNIMR